MNFQKILTVSGMPGLYQLRGYNNRGYYIVSMESGQVKFVANNKNKVLALGNIDLICYDRTIPLLSVLQVMSQTSGSIPQSDSSDQEVINFFRKVLPDYDETKVFLSTLRKVLQWYFILIRINKSSIERPENEKDKGLKIT